MDAIWAEDLNHFIGYNGTLPWHIPKDLAFFKTHTLHSTMIMGRKTFDGMEQKLLPQRKTLVLTKNNTYNAPKEAIVLHSIEDVLNYIKHHPTHYTVIGGTEIFHALLPYCNRILRTIVDGHYNGDTKAPRIPKHFKLTKQCFVPVSKQNEVPLIFEEWVSTIID